MGEEQQPGPSFYGEEADDDRWELGERGKTERRATSRPFSAPSRKKTSFSVLALFGMVLFAAVAWFGHSLMQRPLVTPLPEAVPEPQRAPVAPPAEPTRQAAVEPPHAPVAPPVAVAPETEVAREPQRAPVAPPPPPPLTFSRVEPRSEVVIVEEGETFPFSAQVSGAAPVQYEWRLDGKRVSQERQWSYRPATGEGGKDKKVRVIVSGPEGQRLEREWRVAVRAVEPSPSPPAVAVAPPAPKNTPPHIAQRFPVESKLTAHPGNAIEFSALALDPDEEAVAYEWLVDGKPVAQSEHFSYEAGTVGKHTISLAASDRGGLKDTARWEVDVAAPPAAPRLVMYTPHQERVTLAPNFSRAFAVEVDAPGVEDSALSYAWTIDNRFAGEQALLEIKNLTPGRHEVKVVVRGPVGAPVSQRWSVLVRQPPEEEAQLTIEPPRLVVSNLDNNFSVDKKQVVVSGRIRNIGGREVSNVVAWVSALDAQQRTVSRRLALPAPQPLAPDQVATFQTAFNNREDIVDFHVEVVSK